LQDGDLHDLGAEDIEKKMLVSEDLGPVSLKELWPTLL